MNALELVNLWKSIVLFMDGGRSRRGIRRVPVAFLSILLVINVVMTTLPTVSALDDQGTVEWVHEDTKTKGDWYFNATGSPICVYGSYAHILPNAPKLHSEVAIGGFSTPIGPYDPTDPSFDPNTLKNAPYNWTDNQLNGLNNYRADPTYWDEYVSKDPKITYYVNGTRYTPSPQYGVPYVQYPVFEWASDDWHTVQTEPREVYYTTAIAGTGNGPGWRLCSWDCGAERCLPTYSYMNFTLTFPEGIYLLSLYAYDYSRINRVSQEYRIFNETGSLLASRQVSGEIFDEGVYEIFKVVAPSDGFTIIVQVYNDAGHYVGNPDGSTINVLLSGIFVDKVANEDSAIMSSNSMGEEKNSFHYTEEVYVTVPSLDRWVRLYVVDDKAYWDIGDELLDVSTDGYNLVKLGNGTVETYLIWEPLLKINHYDIVMDVDQDGHFSTGDLIDHCNNVVGFFVIPELPIGTVTAILSSIIALVIYKKK